MFNRTLDYKSAAKGFLIFITGYALVGIYGCIRDGKWITALYTLVMYAFLLFICTKPKGRR